jgi:hypothetical protein
MQIKNVLIVLLLCCFSCKNNDDKNAEQKFDKLKWTTKEGMKYPYRNKMLNDLVYKQKLKGLKKDEVLHMLGQPNRVDTNYFFYIVDQSFLGDIALPMHTKSLVIKFLNDTVEWRKIKE